MLLPPFAFEALFLPFACAVEKDARRASNVSMPCGIAMLLEGERMLCTVAKALEASESMCECASSK